MSARRLRRRRYRFRPCIRTPDRATTPNPKSHPWEARFRVAMWSIAIPSRSPCPAAKECRTMLGANARFDVVIPARAIPRVATCGCRAPILTFLGQWELRDNSAPALTRSPPAGSDGYVRYEPGKGDELVALLLTATTGTGPATNESCV